MIGRGGQSAAAAGRVATAQALKVCAAMHTHYTVQLDLQGFERPRPGC
jgi:hypothetical protein